MDENGLPIYYKDGGVTCVENEWITTDEGAWEIARVPQGAYILEETAAPLGDGYVQSMAIGLVVEDTSGIQSFTMEDDYTKLEISKLDMTSREEIAGAELTLYEAYRVYDDTDRGWHLEILLDTAGEPVLTAELSRFPQLAAVIQHRSSAEALPILRQRFPKLRPQLLPVRTAAGAVCWSA